LIYAQSGAGKTSLFNAQIAPELDKNGFQVLPMTRVGIGLLDQIFWDIVFVICPHKINQSYRIAFGRTTDT
jgi:hypothetical protein